MRFIPSEKLSLMEGCEFEITYTKTRFKKVWHKAIIELEPESRQRCVRLLEDDSLSPLSAFTHTASFRPIPTKHFESRVDIKEGSLVDADYKHGWWVGLVVKEIGDDKCLVLFDSPPDVIMFERERLRIHLDWVDETWWVLSGRNAEFLRRLQEKPMFISGTLVEVSDVIDKGEVVWVPAMIVKEIDDEKYIIKVCNKHSSCVGTKKIPNKTVEMPSVRPRPPPFSSEDLRLVEYIEVFHGTSWRQGRVMGRMSQGWCKVLLEATNKLLSFKISDIRPSKVWEDGVWKFLKHDKPVFISGTLVEVSDVIEKGEVVWVPAKIIKESEKENDDEKKYIVKVCDDYLDFEGTRKVPNRSVEMHNVRPRPPPFLAEELHSVEYIEVFHGTSWRQGRVTGKMSHGWCKVLLEATNKVLSFKISDIRPSKVWEDGVWKPRESPFTQGSGDKMGHSGNKFTPVSNSPSPGITATPLIQTRENPSESPLTQGSVINSFDCANESGPTVTPSPSITATPLIQTRDTRTREDNNRKRKREQNLCSVDIDEETKAITAMALPFEKNLPIWKTVESMKVFKTFPQSPHFTPLLEIREDAREMSAVGMMLTFSGLLEEVKALKLNSPIRSLNSLSDSFAELEKNGFDVNVPMLRISKLLSLIDRQAKKMEELESAEKVTAEKESIKVENEHKILELQKLNEEANKEIAQSKSCEAKIGQQLEDVKLEFHTTALAPW